MSEENLTPNQEVVDAPAKVENEKTKVVVKNGKVQKVKKPLTKEEKKQRKIIKKGKRHYWWRYLLVFLTGIIFTIISIAGSIVALSAFVPAEQVLQLVGLNPDEVLTEKYHDKTVYELVMDIINGEIQFNSIGGIRELTPYVDTLIDAVNVELENAIGFSFDKDELYNVGWDQIGTYIFEEIQSGIKLAKILNINQDSNKILIYIGYNQDSDGNPDYSNPRSLGDLINNFETMLDTATLDDLIDCGTSGILYNLRDCSISELATVMETRPLNQIIDIPEDALPALKYIGNFKVDELSDAINNATLEDLVDVGTSGLLYNLRDVKVTELSMVTETRPLNQIIDIAPDSFPALVYIGQFPISQINTALDEATLGDLIPIEEGSPLESMANAKLNELDEEVKHLYVRDVLTITEDSSPILKYLANYRLDELSSVLDTMPLSVALDINEDSPKFLRALAAKGANLSNINAIIDTLTIGELVDCEGNRILEAISGATLNTIGDTINNLTLEQIIDLDDPETPKVLKALATTKINDLAAAMNSLTIGDMVDCEGNMILEALSGATFDSLASTIDNLTLGDVIDVTAPDTPKILRSLAGTKLNELGSAMNALTVSQMIDIDEDSPMILKALANTTLNGLAHKIETLTIGDLFTTDEIANCIFLSAMGADTRVEFMADRINELTFMEVFGDSILEDPNDPDSIKPTWKYLLTDETGEINRTYRIAFDMQKLIDNMQRNFKKATLRTLYNDGFVALENPSILDKKILGQVIGDLTLSQLIELVGQLAS